MNNHLDPVAIIKVQGIILYYFHNMGRDKRIQLISFHLAYLLIT